MSVIKLLQALIRTESPSGAEDFIARFLKDVLSGVGVDKVWIDGLGNVIALIKGEVGGPPLIVEAHMDVVGPGVLSAWKVDPYSAVIINGKIYGRGAVDTKASIASQIYSISLIRRFLVDTYFVYTTHEETAEGVAFRYVIEESIGRRPGIVIIGEATSLNLGIGHRGRAVIKVVVKGEEAHASMPEEGINALRAIAKFIHMLSTVQLRKDPLLGTETIEPTIISCSSRDVPQIPGLCTLLIDMRIIRDTAPNDVLAKFRPICDVLIKEALCRDCSLSINRDKLKFWTGEEIEVFEYFPAWVCSDEEVISTSISALKHIDIDAKEYIWRFSTDGVYSGGTLNVPTIGFGPGDERLAHKPNEYVYIKDVELAVKGYAELIKSLNELLSSR